VRFALQKIHQGRPLLFPEEGALAGLYHEIMHAGQLAAQLTETQLVLVETVTEWTARRRYPELLRELGVEPRHLKAMKEQGIGLRQGIGRFDGLLKKLGIKEEDILDRLVEINKSEPTDSFLKHVAELLEKKARNKPAYNIADALEKLDDDDFEQTFL
jgi:hypothetical protein